MKRPDQVNVSGVFTFPGGWSRVPQQNSIKSYI